MISKSWLWALGIGACLSVAAWGGTFGKVVPIGGMATDLALDESRGLLYVANFTANRVEVISLSDNTVLRSINVASRPSSLAVSPDYKYLVIAHYGNLAAPLPQNNALTVINLETNERQTFALNSAPFGVAFGASNTALVATATEFDIFDPSSGVINVFDTIDGIKSKTIPQPPATFPLTITQASLAASRDGSKIFGLTDSLLFSFDVFKGELKVNSYVSSPPQGPRVVSVNDDGSAFISGWVLSEGNPGLLGLFGTISEFRSATGDLNVGSHAYDSFRNLIYAQVPRPGFTEAELDIQDSDNLAVRERLHLRENLSGKSVLNSDSSVMYSISASGITVLPVGAVNQTQRLTSSQEDVVFRGSFCNPQPSSQEVTIFDISGANTDFKITSSNPGVKVSPASGVTPATVRVSIDPNAFKTQKGTSTVMLTVASAQAVNFVNPIRVLINNHEPDQKGTFINVPGKLVDILPDPARDRFYVLRQDKNLVLVFDANTNTQIATLRTGNLPTQMAITFDRKYLLVGGDATQLLYVFDLNTLKALEPVRMPGGHYPRSVASAGNAILVASRVAGPVHTIDRVDLATRTATQLPTLGVYKNDININTTLVAAANGSSIMAAEADGNVLLYDATEDTFSISRKDTASLSGAYAASDYNQFVIGNTVFNSSLVPISQLDQTSAKSSGFSFIDALALRITAPDSASPGIIQKFDFAGGNTFTNRLIEAPMLSDPTTPQFTRTLAPLVNRKAIVALTTSGFTVIPWNFEVGQPAPKIDSVVNSADFTGAIANSGLITIMGSNLASTSQSFGADSCVQVNGIPLAVLFASPTQINAQLPQVDGDVTLRLATPGGVVDNFALTISPSAPSIFRIPVPGLTDQIPAIIRASNNQLVTPSNPVHRGDVLTIFLTGLGQSGNPAGTPAPADPLVSVPAPTVTIGGVRVEVLFAGLAPGQIGVYQINVKVNNNVPLALSELLQITQASGSTAASVRVVQ